MASSKTRLSAAALAARAVGGLARAFGFGGTSLPGKVFLRLVPDGLQQLASLLPEGVALISATNGKTTTAALAKQILEREGRAVLNNRSGANMAGGVTTALLERNGAAFGLFEVDELWLPIVLSAVAPKAVLLSNLLRDQLDRYGELELIADRWRAAVESTSAQLVLCADDPLLASIGTAAKREPLFFGIEDQTAGTATAAHAADARHCRRCGAPLSFKRHFIAHLGHYRCNGCGAGRPTPQVAASQIKLNGVSGSSFLLTTPQGTSQIELSLPGLYNVYNAVGAAALCFALGAGQEAIASALNGTQAAFGRAERLPAGGREVVILLIKNPAGATEVVRTLALEPAPLDLLMVLNDRIADGRDVSWIWDAEFEVVADKVGALVCAGTRAQELALRMKYAGVAEGRIVSATDLRKALSLALGKGDPARPLYALPTYTAMLELRRLLGRGGRRLRRGG